MRSKASTGCTMGQANGRVARHRALRHSHSARQQAASARRRVPGDGAGRPRPARRRPGHRRRSRRPATLELVAPRQIARWRPLVHWLLGIPYYIVLYVLQIALGVVTFVAWFVILFTGNIPEGMFAFMASVHRFQWRYSSYILFLREP